MARKMQRLHCAMLTASSHGDAQARFCGAVVGMVLPRGRSFAVARFCEP